LLLCTVQLLLQYTAMTTVEFNHKLISYKSNLQNYAYMLTMNYDDANDLVQDTYVKALSNKDKFEPSTNMKAWVYTIMKNTFINNFRRNTKSNTIFDHSKDLYYINTSSGSKISNPETDINFNDISREVNSLNDDQKIPFTMHINGFKYREIASEMNMSIGTVKSRIFFTRKRLMEKLKDFNPQEQYQS
jgi:RNA polymerase sigma-70 factor (ECF subfamily)